MLFRSESALAAVAEQIDAPVCTTVSGHGSLAATHPLLVGVVGANGGVEATKAVLESADTVLFIGCRIGSTTTEHWQMPPRQITIVHLDVDPMTIATNYRTDVALVGDAANWTVKTVTVTLAPPPFEPLKPQTISFTAPQTSLGIGLKLGLTGTASSALPVTYTTTTPTICSISGHSDDVTMAPRMNAISTSVNTACGLSLRCARLRWRNSCDRRRTVSVIGR